MIAPGPGIGQSPKARISRERLPALIGQPGRAAPDPPL